MANKTVALLTTFDHEGIVSINRIKGDLGSEFKLSEAKSLGCFCCASITFDCEKSNIFQILRKFSEFSWEFPDLASMTMQSDSFPELDGVYTSTKDVNLQPPEYEQSL